MSDTPLTINPEDIVRELRSEPLGAALWDRAQLAVTVTVQAARIEELERLVPDGPP
ncbi:hypothetical protein [Pseudonocardia charpentierae]|uniref:Uncharacterized protein n=1 Tax=Pseudonocardia charpentierae TaxID=3075545 RepID=A0ABU2NIE1_9PSEU|nr:hypothetical protein [Pseudonocardia sp. DSM 45834]MDT0353736.1 hypothetical protein [Pseudonocardia sp. DSM 45834]